MSLSGGEPLLHPKLNEVVGGLTDVGLQISFYTTGIQYDTSGQAVAREDWTMFPVGTKFIFSLHASSARVHDVISGRSGAGRLTEAAIRAACAQGHWVETHIVPTKLNLNQLEETVRTALQWGVSRVSFLRLVPQGYAALNHDQLAMSAADEDKLREIMKGLSCDPAVSQKVRFGIPFSGKLNGTKKCTAAESKLIIRHDGKILPCEAFKDDRFACMILGDISDTTLSEALKAAKANDLLQCAKLRMHGCESCPAQLLYANDCFTPSRFLERFGSC